jgi:ElaB/YqjD/DUF883 family membrane-anchored ribosome-binding protein
MTVQSAKSTITSIETGADNDADGPEEIEESAASATDDTLAELEQQLRQTADALKESAKALGDLASLQVQQRPLAAVGVAFLAGLVAAKILRR